MAWIKKPKRNKTRKKEGARNERMKVYNSSLWRRLRNLKIRENPLCEVCEISGKIVQAEDIHHLRSFTEASSLAERDTLAYDYENLLSVCDACHNSLHHGNLRGCQSLEEIKKVLKNAI